jgi:cell division protein FtsL
MGLGTPSHISERSLRASECDGVTSVRVDRRGATAPARRPKAQPQPRPRLRVVPPDYVPPRIRRRRARLVLVGCGTLFALGLLAIASLHVVLAQGQFELERLETRAAAEQAKYDRLRLQVAELEAPERVVAAAQQRLGMVPAPGVTYLSPEGPMADEPARQHRDGDVPALAGEDWARVKPHLAEG